MEYCSIKNIKCCLKFYVSESGRILKWGIFENIMKASINKADDGGDDMYHLCQPVETVLWKAVPEPPESLFCTALALVFIYDSIHS